jgi:hypothetical protein
MAMLHRMCSAHRTNAKCTLTHGHDHTVLRVSRGVLDGTGHVFSAFTGGDCGIIVAAKGHLK